ncbi:MAG: VanW family protein [Clostridia bacterium]|nr:VanW family protein [Clostridia bacterium]
MRNRERVKKEDKGAAKSRKRIIVLCVALILAAMVAAFTYLAVCASTDKIYDGVYVGDVSLGGKTAKQAVEILERKYPAEELNIRLRCEGVEFDIYGSQISLRADYEASAKAAEEFGKDGNIFSKIYNMKKLSGNVERIPLVFTCDTDMLNYMINENLSQHVVDVTQYTVEIGEDCIIVTNGKNGYGVNVSKVMKLVSEAYTSGRISECIDIEIEEVKADIIDPESFFDEYNRDPVDAVCEQEGESINIIPEVVGITLKHDETIKILEENKHNEQSYTIPAVITYPDVTAEELEAEFTDCIIGTYSTNYSSSSANRKENIRLASSAISGKILNPGEVFSFNDVVGPRTAATGYKIAHVYSGGKTVDGIGGGICQVSSTLYNAVVFADLEIVYRTNHTLPVSYVPLGRDATVSYGTIDFKFKNNKETPVKIEVIADGNNLTVNIYGRKKYIKDISIETAITGTIAFSTTEIKDDTMYEGERKTEEKGANGTKVEAYKIIKEDGVVVSKTLLCKSSYVPTSQVIRVGTRKRETAVLENDNEVSSASSYQPETSTQMQAPQEELVQTGEQEVGSAA